MGWFAYTYLWLACIIMTTLLYVVHLQSRLDLHGFFILLPHHVLDSLEAIEEI